ncbi:GNAT family N-acetyltransferase [Streptomyces sp. NK08204]|uniref:GNAT family N-acetyltransferase n=1 Tax=Streptomyces sp. NK08204 TaxID=2873260 RepID=UPI001CEC1740|nr:GNAT family N-acetyltransferase [Streptomyces sp. NK08204]
MIDVRAVDAVHEAEFADWQRAMSTGFLLAPVLSANQLADRRRYFDQDRLLGAFDGDRCVATFRSFAQEVTAVGGALVPSNAISNVTVSPTHRRQGLLTRMMSRDLTAAHERGDVLATLIAAEYPIYGRYGFGPAASMTEWTVDVLRAGLDPHWSGPADGGRIDLVDGADVRKLGPELFERYRRSLPGAVSRDTLWWQLNTGVLDLGYRPWTEPYHAVYRSAAGQVEGLVTYDADGAWSGKHPDSTAVVRSLIATTVAAQRALWHFLCSIDRVTKVRSGRRGPDDLLPLLLPDPRAARITGHGDWLWVRILDVVRALEARTYGGEGVLVLEVVDGAGTAGGRYRLEVSPEGASCVPTRAQSADLTLGAAELATVWLGDESLQRLAALGRVQEEREGAARKADALLRPSGRPYCPDMF